MLILILSLVFVNTLGVNSTPASLNDLITKIQSISSSSANLEIKEDSTAKKPQEELIISSLSSVSNSSILATLSTKIPTFTGDQFKQLYQSQKLPNTIESQNVPEVTGYLLIDEYIRNMAVKRGFVKQPLPDESKLITVQNYKVQPQAGNAFLKIQELALKDNIRITLVSAYRSPIEQKAIFAPILPQTYYEEDLLAGGLDKVLNEGMDTIAPPGFSRHHTGYAMDFGCDTLEVTKFRETPCYAWLKKDNFKVLVDNNLIPSYPEGTTNQGPAPEEWEFVWVEKI